MVRWVLWIAMATLSFGCAKPVPPPAPDPAPAVTPPEAPPEPEVSAEDRARIREYMWALALEVRALDEELSVDGGSDGDHYAVQVKLERIRAIIRDLEAENDRIQHPMLTESLSRFAEQVDFALRAAQAAEPSFVTAGKVIGSCSTCHDTRACPFDSYSRCIDESAPGR